MIWISNKQQTVKHLAVERPHNWLEIQTELNVHNITPVFTAFVCWASHCMSCYWSPNVLYEDLLKLIGHPPAYFRFFVFTWITGGQVRNMSYVSPLLISSLFFQLSVSHLLLPCHQTLSTPRHQIPQTIVLTHWLSTQAVRGCAVTMAVAQCAVWEACWRLPGLLLLIDRVSHVGLAQRTPLNSAMELKYKRNTCSQQLFDFCCIWR